MCGTLLRRVFPERAFPKKKGVNVARDQSASMAEYYLGLYDMSCVQRSFCEVATAARTDLMETPEQAAQLSMR